MRRTGRFGAFTANKMCALKEAPVTYFIAETPADCTQQGCSGCEHLLSNTNKGWVGWGERGGVGWGGCLSLLIC